MLILRWCGQTIAKLTARSSVVIGIIPRRGFAEHGPARHRARKYGSR